MGHAAVIVVVVDVGPPCPRTPWPNFTECQLFHVGLDTVPLFSSLPVLTMILTIDCVQLKVGHASKHIWPIFEALSEFPVSITQETRTGLQNSA